MCIRDRTTTSHTVFAAENDGWTEAPYTEAAQGGAWEAWCEKWEKMCIRDRYKEC